MAIKVWGAGSGAGSDGNWSTGANWSGNTIPANGDSIVLDGTCPNALVAGPSVDVTIVNFTITSAESVTGGFAYGNGVVYITGNMTNNSTTFGYFYMDGVGFEGVTSVVGPWRAASTFSRVTDGTYGDVITFEIANLVFDSNNFIEFGNIGGFSTPQNVTICRPSIGSGARPFQSFTIQDASGYLYTYNFNFSNLRVLTQVFNLNNVIFNMVGNDLTSYPIAPSFSGSVVCDTVNLNYTQYTPNDIFQTPYSFFTYSNNGFIFEARVTNLIFNMNSTQSAFVNFGTQSVGFSGVDLKIFVGFNAPTGDVKLNIRGNSYFGLNQGGVFGTGNVNKANFTYSTASINVYDSSAIGVFSQFMGIPIPYNHPTINFYDKSLLAGKSSNCFFYDKSRIAPDLYDIQVYNSGMSPAYCVFLLSMTFSFSDYTNRNSAQSSF